MAVEFEDEITPPGNEIKIYPPVKIIDSEVYYLVIQDQTGKYHYFVEDGSYDGFSMDCNFCDN